MPILAGFALLIRASGLHFISNQPLLIIAAPIALGYMAAFAAAGNRGLSRPGLLLGILFFVGLYSYSLAMVADTLGDHGDVQTYSAQVLGKHISSGRSTSFYLQLAPWGPKTEPSQVSVSSSTYRAVTPGDEVCLQLHPGNLHAPWYRLAACGVSFPEDARQ